MTYVSQSIVKPTVCPICESPTPILDALDSWYRGEADRYAVVRRLRALGASEELVQDFLNETTKKARAAFQNARGEG